LIEYLHSNQKTQRQYLGELETYIAGYIADEYAAGATGQRGL